MKLSITPKLYIDTSNFHDLSIPIMDGNESARAFGIPGASIQPFQFQEYILSVEKGAAVNCFDVAFNPHGNGTHTEGVGHISKEHHSVYQSVQDYILPAILISCHPTNINGDLIITLESIRSAYQNILQKNIYTELPSFKALMVRTLPNDESKLHQSYSGKNPTYIQASALDYIREQGIEHFLTDLPSVDREEDQGVLAAHHAFWNYPSQPRLNATITELIYVNPNIQDGIYILNLLVSGFISDAAPSRPILFPIHE